MPKPFAKPFMWGCIGIMENKMEATIILGGSIGVIEHARRIIPPRNNGESHGKEHLK